MEKLTLYYSLASSDLPPKELITKFVSFIYQSIQKTPLLLYNRKIHHTFEDFKSFHLKKLKMRQIRKNASTDN